MRMMSLNNDNVIKEMLNPEEVIHKQTDDTTGQTMTKIDC